MNLTDLIFPVATVVLAVACYACYKSNKPLREKARKEAEAKEFQRLKDEQHALKVAHEKQFRLDVFGEIECALASPHILDDTAYGSDYRGKPRFKRLYALIQTVQRSQDQAERIANLEGRVSTQSKLIRDLQLQQKEILKALQLGQPVITE